MHKRYIIIEGSQSGHCCFDFTVIDTESGFKIYPQHGGERIVWNSPICETFNRKDAELVCDALNAVDVLSKSTGNKF